MTMPTSLLRRGRPVVPGRVRCRPRPRPATPVTGADAGASNVKSQYDPTRTKKIYARKSQELQEWVEKLWRRYRSVDRMSRWSQVLRVYGNDPTDTLRSFLVRDLYDFFYWLLGERRGRIKKARTV
ncbi:hypothetical protein LTR12_018243 [Friedmanniomyces endolithicus]|nr:hypothetical protein LTR74_018427 [Friedmanniomyces endolithicus]KAK1807408.1 hypothetical protein LTR12_018243 [Friedmanniomyces endolithicus]